MVFQLCNLPERRAVKEFLIVIWRDCLDSEAGSVWLDELLCGLGRAEDDLTPYLRVWIESSLRTAYEHLVQYVDRNSATLLKRRHLSNAFWADAETQMAQVVNWLSSPQTIESLENLFMENVDATFSDALAAAVDRLTGLQCSLRAQ